MEQPKSYDVIVIGGGPGGYPAAIRAAQLGAKVALVEKAKLGGECTNYGCIPTKTALSIARAIHKLRNIGISVDAGSSLEAIARHVREIVSRVSRGIRLLLTGYDVDLYEGVAAEGANGRFLILSDGTKLEFNSLVVASGSEPAYLDVLPVDGKIVHDNRTALSLLGDPPESILIVGGGYAGLEFANLFHMLGSRVYVVEVMDKVLPGMDPDLARVASRSLRREGVKIYTGASVESYKFDGHMVNVKVSGVGELRVDSILVSIGRRPSTDWVRRGLPGVDLDDKGFIVVDKRLSTTRPGVYAAGDVAGPPLLAHKAMFQAVVAGENAAGGSLQYEPGAIPLVVFTKPEIVSVGLTREQAIAMGYDVDEVKYPAGSSPRVMTEGVINSMVKIVYEKGSTRILGIHIAAPDASELAGEAVSVINSGFTLSDLAEAIHPHPTISEILQEAAELALGKPKHYILKTRKA